MFILSVGKLFFFVRSGIRNRSTGEKNPLAFPGVIVIKRKLQVFSTDLNARRSWRQINRNVSFRRGTIKGRWGFTGAGNEERTCTMPARTASKDRTQPEARGTSSARYSKEENHRSILHFYTKRATTTTNVSALFRPDGVF